MPRMTDRKALVTGAASGIGAATARRLAAEGAAVLVADLDADGVATVVAELADGGAQISGATLDVADPQSWQAAVSAATEHFGGLDVLVNVAGIVEWAGVEDTDLAGWERVVAINQTGTWLGMKTALPALVASGNASIVNTSSVLGIIGGGGAAAYHATKGAVRLLTKTAAVEYATRGVRVNSVHPGVIATPMIAEILDAEGDQQRDVQRTPMRRAGRADEIAAGIAFLASDDATFITGTELVIDGGRTAH